MKQAKIIEDKVDFAMTVSILACIFILLFVSIVEYMDLPIVAMDGDKCVWIQSPPDYERQTCPSTLPEKYEVMYVKSINQGDMI